VLVVTFAAKHRHQGFTILELAIVLFVVALLLGSLLVPLQSQIENRKTDETRRSLELAHDMLLGFAAANGYFPCPADASSSGREAPGSNHATGTCPVWQGYLPAALLGFKPTDAQGFALDGWALASNRIRYAIASHTLAGVMYPFTRVNGFRSIPVSSFGNPALFHVCQSGNGVTASDCGSAVTLASNAVAVVWSVGANGATGGTGVHESQNPNPNGGTADNVFVTRAPSNVAGNEFDDIVTWIPATALINRLVQVGQFTPAAQTAISPP
jgi:prepilin-type N-terminal cleavage/methylation domain-containing protein